MDEPTATVIARSNLFLTDTVTAVTCSAAFPTKGYKALQLDLKNLKRKIGELTRRIRATNSRLMFPLLVKPSILSTNHSAVTPVRIVTSTNSSMVAWIFNFGIVSSTSVDTDETDDVDDVLELWWKMDGRDGREGIWKTR